MEILRWGARRDHGSRTIVKALPIRTESKLPWENNIRWDAKTKKLEILPRWVPHTDGVTRHNYAIRLTLDDISSLIGLLGHAAAATDAKLLRDHLSQHVPAIVKLLACATGVAPVPIAEEERE